MNSLKSPALSIAAALPVVAREFRKARRTWKNSDVLGVDLLTFAGETRAAIRYYAHPAPPLSGATNGSPGSYRYYVLGTLPKSLTRPTPARRVRWPNYFRGACIGHDMRAVPRRYVSRPLVGIFGPGGSALVAGYNLAAEGGPLGKGETIPHFVIVPLDVPEPETFWSAGKKRRSLAVSVSPL